MTAPTEPPTSGPAVAPGVGLPLRKRSHTYTLLVGVVVGMLLAGLVVPVLFGEPVGQSARIGAAPPALPTDAGAPPSVDPQQPDPDAGPTTGLPGAPTSPETASSVRSPQAAPTGAATGPPTGAQTVDGSPPPQAMTASDRGVTAQRIKLGFVLVDLSTASRFGATVLIDPEEQREIWQAFVDHLNAGGGILGRLVDAVYRSVDVIDNDTARAACLAFADDEQVFAAMGIMIDLAGDQCLTHEKQTPFLGSTARPDEVYSSGLLFTLRTRNGRIALNWIAELSRLGLVDGHAFGILSDSRVDPRGSATAILERELLRAGATKVETVRLSSDMAAASSRVPVAVSQMRTADVDTVLLAANSVNASQFVIQAEGQRWLPTYYVSDIAQLADNDNAPDKMPQSFDNTLGITTARVGEERAGLTPPPRARECEDIFREMTGKEPPEDLLHTYCDLLHAFVAGAQRAGPVLTRPGWAQAMQGIGSLPMATNGGGTFALEKFDYADAIRHARWRYDCRCWLPAGDFHPPAHR